MILPIEKKCVKCGQPWEQHDQNYCHSPVEKNDVEIERIVNVVRGLPIPTKELEETIAEVVRDELTTFKAHIEAALLEEIEEQLPLEFSKKTPAFQMGWGGALAHLKDFITKHKEQI